MPGVNLKFNFGLPGQGSNLPVPAELTDYIKKQKQAPESFIQAPFEKPTLPKSSNGGALVVIGIGGSNLGALAIWQALRPEQKIYFIETFDARRLERLLAKAKHPWTIFIVSKSGTTSETVANASVFLGKLKREDKVIAITDEGSRLWEWAEDNEFSRIAVPKEIGGRYSVFTAVGLAPLAMAGLDIARLLKGARDITESCLSADLSKNPAAQSALAIYQNWKSGKIIHDTFIFEPDLEELGKWYRQLIGESIGKNGKGITPTVSIGTTDLHSVAQLYLDGPKDKFTTFISAQNRGADFDVSSKFGLTDLVPDIAGKKFSVLMDAVLAGVKATYKKKKLPFVEITLADISEESLGALMQMKMIETAYLGKLMGVNAFDEPAVELYKEEVRKLLKDL